MSQHLIPSTRQSLDVDPALLVNGLYEVVLGRVPDTGGFHHWVAHLRAHGNPVELVSALINSAEYRNQARHLIAGGAARGSLYYCNSSIDPEAIMRRHAVTNLRSRSEYLTNFLGVLINPDHFGAMLTACRGLVEEIPIPMNWHADMAEWGAALRAVDLARETFTMVELGCGWGCWMNNSGVAARRLGLRVKLIGVEGDAGHLAFAREATAANGFLPNQVILHHGIAAANSGTALFPRQSQAGVSWGSQPIFHATDDQRTEATRMGSHDVLSMISLADIVEKHPKIDLLHIDIQGGEADLVLDALPTLNETIVYIVIGTHSRQIEGRLFDILLNAGWRLEIERPALLSINQTNVSIGIDGIQGWRNPLYSIEN